MHYYRPVQKDNPLYYHPYESIQQNQDSYFLMTPNQIQVLLIRLHYLLQLVVQVCHMYLYFPDNRVILDINSNQKRLRHLNISQLIYLLRFYQTLSVFFFSFLPYFNLSNTSILVVLHIRYKIT